MQHLRTSYIYLVHFTILITFIIVHCVHSTCIEQRETSSIPEFLSNLNIFDDKSTRIVFNESQTLSLVENFSSRNVSKRCQDSLIIYFNEIFHLKSWALEMLDASGKIPSSVFSGTLIDFGSLDDCIRVNADSQSGNHLFKGKFCMVHARHPLFQTPYSNPHIEKSYTETFGESPDWIRSILENDMTLRFGMNVGICVPSTCTDEEIYEVVSTITEPLQLHVTLTDCQIDEPRKIPFLAKLVIALLVTLLLLCFSGTFLDLNDRKVGGLQIQGERLWKQLVKAFSLYTNTNNLFKVDPKKQPLDCIHGLRLILCFTVILGHMTIYPTMWKELRYKNFHFVHEFLYVDVTAGNNSVFIVEGFFCISAFLLMYKILKKPGENINILENIEQRYWRCTPVLLFIMLIYFAMPLLNTGPVWDSNWDHEQNKCLYNGYKNLLYIQNFDDMLDMCWVHTWHLSSTMQLFVISLLLIAVTNRFPKSGVFLNVLLFFGTIIYYYNLSLKLQCPMMSFNYIRYTHTTINFLSQIYIKTLFHLPSNLLGMLFAWLYLKYGKQKVSKVWLSIGWFTCILCFAYNIFGVFVSTQDFRIMALYNSTRTSFFCVGICWIIYVCGSGQANLLDKAMSWKGLIPISRISFCIYMVHPLYLIYRDASIAERFYMDKISQLSELALYVTFAITAAFIVYLTVEEPCNKIYDILKTRKTANSVSQNGATTKVGNAKKL